MQNILLAGDFTANQIETLLTTIKQMLAVTLTVYTKTPTTWPKEINVISGELTDLSGLTAAMVYQDLVLTQFDAGQLVSQTETVLAALPVSNQARLVVASPDSILSLTNRPVKWYQQHHQRQRLAQLRTSEQLLGASGVNFTMLQGQTAADMAIYTRAMQPEWLTAVPARRPLQLWDYLTVTTPWSLVA